MGLVPITNLKLEQNGFVRETIQSRFGFNYISTAF